MLTISDYVLRSAGISSTELRLEVALYLYAKNRLSFGQARKLAGVNVLEFQAMLAQNNIEHHYNLDALTEDFEAIQQYKSI